MKITGTRSTLIVETEGKILIIKGELTVIPAFYADSDSIEYWEPPFDNIKISEEEKLRIIEEVKKYNENREVKIIFE
jgi:hypothetical protein